MTRFGFGHDMYSTFLNEQVPRLEGWCTPEKAIKLADWVVMRRPVVSVDLGVFGGRSMLALAAGHISADHGYVCGIDLWEVAPTQEGTNDPANDEWWREVDLAGIGQEVADYFAAHVQHGRWQILRAHSVAAAEYFADHEVGLLHQDSNHASEVAMLEMDAWLPKMTPGGLWVMDDTNWPSLQAAIAYGESRGLRLLEEHLVEGGNNWRVYEVPR